MWQKVGEAEFECGGEEDQVLVQKVGEKLGGGSKQVGNGVDIFGTYLCCERKNELKKLKSNFLIFFCHFGLYPSEFYKTS